MPRTKSWRFLSNIRSMLPLTIFKAMAGWLRPAGPGAFHRCRKTVRTVSHPPGAVWAGSTAVYRFRADEAEARRGVLCRAERLAEDRRRKWLTKWRPKSADLSVRVVETSGIKGPVRPVYTGGQRQVRTRNNSELKKNKKKSLFYFNSISDVSIVKNKNKKYTTAVISVAKLE